MGILKKYRNFKTRMWLKQQIHLNQADLRIVVGAGGVYEAGWIPTDINTLNILQRHDWEALFHLNSIQAILAEHVWEHLTPEDGLLAMRHCYQFLRSGGYLRIAIPDGFHPETDYIEHVKVNGSGVGADDHKVLYTYKTLSSLLEKAGFKVERLEYFDESGNFHKTDWKPETGKINRSIRFDQRNADGQPHYTSLILDGVKA